MPMLSVEKFFFAYAFIVALVGGLILYWMSGMPWAYHYSEQMRLVLSITPAILVIAAYGYCIFLQLRKDRDKWIEENQQPVKCAVSGALYLISNNTDHPDHE
jgi:hypothetical protein